jgi:hypothetical protein
MGMNASQMLNGIVTEMLRGSMSPAVLSPSTLDLIIKIIHVTCKDCSEWRCGISPMGEGGSGHAFAKPL